MDSMRVCVRNTTLGLGPSAGGTGTAVPELVIELVCDVGDVGRDRICGEWECGWDFEVTNVAKLLTKAIGSRNGSLGTTWKMHVFRYALLVDHTTCNVPNQEHVAWYECSK